MQILRKINRNWRSAHVVVLLEMCFSRALVSAVPQLCMELNAGLHPHREKASIFDVWGSQKKYAPSQS